MYLVALKQVLHLPLLNILSILLFIFIALFVLSLIFELSIRVMKVVLPILGWGIVIMLVVMSGVFLMRSIDLMALI